MYSMHIYAQYNITQFLKDLWTMKGKDSIPKPSKKGHKPPVNFNRKTGNKIIIVNRTLRELMLKVKEQRSRKKRAN